MKLNRSTDDILFLFNEEWHADDSVITYNELPYSSYHLYQDNSKLTLTYLFDTLVQITFFERHCNVMFVCGSTYSEIANTDLSKWSRWEASVTYDPSQISHRYFKTLVSQLIGPDCSIVEK